MGKQVKTPRFYVDIPTFLHATGDSDWGISQTGGIKLLYMNPSNPYTRPDTPDNNWLFRIGDFDKEPKTSFPINFCALLNHNLASDDAKFKIKGIHKEGTTDSWPTLTSSDNYKANILNANKISADLSLQYNGTTIFELNNPNNELNKYWRFFGIEYQSAIDSTLKHQLGSLVVGKYWDVPYSPDIQLTMERNYKGIKTKKSQSGKVFGNINYDGPAQWFMNGPSSEGLHTDVQNEHWTSDNGPEGFYRYAPFELDLPTPITRHETDSDGYITNYDDVEKDYNRRVKPNISRKGLRSWNLTFSFISDDDMWISYENSSHAPFEALATGLDSTTDTDIPQNDGVDVSNYPNPILSDNSFNFVWNATLGGALPFIFQPDAPQYDTDGNMTQGNNNTDQFSICTFRDNSLSVTQTSNNVYNLSVKIDEVA